MSACITLHHRIDLREENTRNEQPTAPQHSGDDGGLGSSSAATRAAAAAHPLPRITPYAMTRAELEAELRYERPVSSPDKRFCLFPFPQHFSSHIVSAILE